MRRLVDDTSVSNVVAGRKTRFTKHSRFCRGKPFPHSALLLCQPRQLRCLIVKVPSLSQSADIKRKVLSNDVTSETADAASLESCCRHVSIHPLLACGRVSRRGACLKGLLGFTQTDASASATAFVATFQTFRKQTYKLAVVFEIT